MLIRYTLAFASLAGLSALSLAAPAPVYKPKHPSAEAVLKQLEGTYAMQTAAQQRLLIQRQAQAAGGALGGVVRTTTLTTHIRIQGDRWMYVRNVNGVEQVTTTYRMKLDPSKKPMWLDLVRDGTDTPTMQGIVTAEGDTVKFGYLTTTSIRQGEARPKTLDANHPDAPRLMMTLTRLRDR